jgi:hypothetical protein
MTTSGDRPGPRRGMAKMRDLGAYWFADIDNEADEPYVWQPCLETGEGLVPHIEIWFDSKERCEDWIRKYLIGAPLEDAS